MARVTNKENSENLGMGSRLLAVLVYPYQHFQFGTYNSTSYIHNNQNVNHNFEGIWNFIYCGY